MVHLHICSQFYSAAFHQLWVNPGVLQYSVTGVRCEDQDASTSHSVVERMATSAPQVDFMRYFGLDDQTSAHVESVDVYIEKLIGPTIPKDMFIINVGANDGATSDPVYSLFAAGASGLLVEVNSDLYSLLKNNVPWNRTIKLNAPMTPSNIVNVLIDHKVPQVFDIFKIDIDSFDLFVVDALLQNQTFAPKLIIMEINEKIPPPIQFTINQCNAHGWRGDNCFGASIEKIIQFLSIYRYSPVALNWNNLYLIPSNLVNASLDTSAKSLYDVGYWKRSGRAQKFPWNADIDNWAERAHSPTGVMRDIFVHMSKTKTFQESGCTFELSLPRGSFV